MAGYPIVIVLRAFSHIFSALWEPSICKKHPQTLDNPKSSLILTLS